MTQQMQNTMHNQKLNFPFDGMSTFYGLFRRTHNRDDHITVVTAACLWVLFVRREDKHIRRCIVTEEIPIEALDPSIIHERNRHIPIRDSGKV